MSVGAVRAQTSPEEFVSIVVTNNVGAHDTLRIGIAEGATYGIDQPLGETEYPPFPPSAIFESRIVNIPNHPTSSSQGGLGEGVKLDIRPYLGSTQSDTFRIKVQAGDNGYPITFTWGNDLKKFARALTIKGGGKPTPVDMLTTTTFTIDDPDATPIVTIIRQDDPVAGVDAPSHNDALNTTLNCTPSIVTRGQALQLSGQALRGAKVIEIFDAIGARVLRIEPTGPVYNDFSVATEGLATGRYHLLVRARATVAHVSFVVFDR